jgi:hypothetical protein
LNWSWKLGKRKTFRNRVVSRQVERFQGSIRSPVRDTL